MQQLAADESSAVWRLAITENGGNPNITPEIRYLHDIDNVLRSSAWIALHAVSKNPPSSPPLLPPLMGTKQHAAKQKANSSMLHRLIAFRERTKRDYAAALEREANDNT